MRIPSVPRSVPRSAPRSAKPLCQWVFERKQPTQTNALKIHHRGRPRADPLRWHSSPSSKIRECWQIALKSLTTQLRVCPAYDGHAVSHLESEATWVRHLLPHTQQGPLGTVAKHKEGQTTLVWLRPCNRTKLTRNENLRMCL